MVTDAALFIEQILSATGPEGASALEVERPSAALGKLAAIAIQAAQDAAGKEIRPGSVLELLAVSTPANGAKCPDNGGDCPCGRLNGSNGLRPLSREARYLRPSTAKALHPAVANTRRTTMVEPK
jgi:hypothetical protein